MPPASSPGISVSTVNNVTCSAGRRNVPARSAAAIELGEPSVAMRTCMLTFYPGDGDHCPVRRRGGPDRVEHAHLGQPVGERRHGDRRLGGLAPRPGAQRLGEPRVGPELEVRVALAGVVGDRRRLGQREVGRHREHAAPAPIGARHAVGGDLDRPVACRRRPTCPRPQAPTTPPSAGARPRAPPRVVICTTKRVLRAAARAPTVGSVGAHGRDLAQPRADLVDDVRARRAEPTPAAPGVEPPFRDGSGRIGDERHVLHQREQARLADSAVARSHARRGPGPAPTGTRARPDASRRRVRAAASMRSASAASSANGFSHTHVATGRRTPRSRAPRACRAGWRS